jgi:hydroxymethylpyrimidine pyrophosphatase-like HAD family hydrolase
MIVKNRPISELSKKDLSQIKLIVFDVDGVLVSRGTKIKQKGDITTLETKRIEKGQIEQIKRLHKLGFKININSGRGLYMLLEMFREVLPFVSLTYENGSATWYKGKIYQHVNSFEKLKDVIFKLRKVKSKSIKGFEPKTFIITIHCSKRVPSLERILSREKGIYYIWNSEAYDIGVKVVQTKARGIKAVMKMFKIKRSGVMTLGDNYNDKEMLEVSGISVTADKNRVSGDYYIPLDNRDLPAKKLMSRVIGVLKN